MVGGVDIAIVKQVAVSDSRIAGRIVVGSRSETAARSRLGADKGTGLVTHRPKLMSGDEIQSDAIQGHTGEEWFALQSSHVAQESSTFPAALPLAIARTKSLRWAVANAIPVLTPQLFVGNSRMCDEDTDLGLEYTLHQMLSPQGKTARASVKPPPAPPKLAPIPIPAEPVAKPVKPKAPAVEQVLPDEPEPQDPSEKENEP